MVGSEPGVDAVVCVQDAGLGEAGDDVIGSPTADVHRDVVQTQRHERVRVVVDVGVGVGGCVVVAGKFPPDAAVLDPDRGTPSGGVAAERRPVLVVAVAGAAGRRL